MNQIHDPNKTLLVPELVLRAKREAERTAFQFSCLDSVGRLLMTLAAASHGPILELGTGAGVSTAWLASANRQPLHSFDIDVERVVAARALFVGRDDVAINVGDFSIVDDSLCFGLAFIDVAEQKDDGQAVIDAMEEGGVIVLDDFTPEWLKPEESRNRSDERRNFWLRHEELRSVEIFTTSSDAAIIATKRPLR